MSTVLYLVIPCYNEEKVLPLTSGQFLRKLKSLIAEGTISDESRILFVDDGSKDMTWDIITTLSRQDPHYIGISQSRNRGHQNALLAGLMEAKDVCDAAISMDCDGQDDIDAISLMLAKYQSGSDIVYGVRCSRRKDSFFKRVTAEGFYHIMNHMGCEVVFNHADYRLLSSRVLQELANYKEVNIFLRGMIPLVGFDSSCVYYEREERQAGETHYPLTKMLGLAMDGITSLTTYPIHLIMGAGVVVSVLSMAGILWALLSRLAGHTVDGWTSLMCMICLLSGIEIFALGVIGEYVGKTYMETKARPRSIIRERTYEVGAAAHRQERQDVVINSGKHRQEILAAKTNGEAHQPEQMHMELAQQVYEEPAQPMKENAEPAQPAEGNAAKENAEPVQLAESNAAEKTAGMGGTDYSVLLAESDRMHVWRGRAS